MKPISDVKLKAKADGYFPQQRDLITKRWRSVKAPRQTELQVHISVVEYVRLMGHRDVVMEHSANGEKRDKRDGAKLKAMGVLPGAADLTFTRRATWSLDCLPVVLKLELKSAGGKQSEAQKAYEIAIKATGAHYEIADSLDTAIAILERYNMVKPRQAAGRL